MSPTTPNHQPFSGATVKVALVAVFTALSLGTNYAMISLPNIKLMDTFVFVAAFLFGLRVGVGVGVLTWLVYGFVNPYGLAGPMLFFLMIGESFYAVAGALFRRTGLSERRLRTESSHTGLTADGQVYQSRMSWSFIILGVTGLFAALAYDVFTNTTTWLLQLYDPSRSIGTLLFQAVIVGLITMNFPLPMGLMHQISDMFFFATVAPLAIKATRKIVAAGFL